MTLTIMQGAWLRGSSLVLIYKNVGRKIKMAMLQVECPLCKEVSVLAGFLQDKDLIGTSLEGLPIREAEKINNEHIEQNGFPIVLDEWEKWELTLNYDDETAVCPNCKRRARLTKI